MSAIRLHSISLSRGTRRVLDRVDARFSQGKLTVVIGPNGAGKSTLLDVAAGLLRPDEGGVSLGDTPIETLSRRELARRRAYLPQSPVIDWPISVERVVALGLTAHLPAFGGIPRIWQQPIEAALAKYDLVSLRDRPATEVSGGELARVMLARATVSAPEVLIVDEPMAGLDPRHAIDAGMRLRALADEGCTVIVAIHDLSLALRIADTAVAIREGRVAAQGAVSDVFTDDFLGNLYEVEVQISNDVRGPSVRFIA